MGVNRRPRRDSKQHTRTVAQIEKVDNAECQFQEGQLLSTHDTQPCNTRIHQNVSQLHRGIHASQS